MATQTKDPRRRRLSYSFKGVKSRTKQEFAKDADINNIMAKYIKTGLVPVSTRQPTYGDFSDGGDFRSILDRVMAAEEDFQSLPSDLRSQFNNNPAELLDFLSDPANQQEAIDLGIIPGETTQDPVCEEPENPLTTASEEASE